MEIDCVTLLYLEVFNGFFLNQTWGLSLFSLGVDNDSGAEFNYTTVSFLKFFFKKWLKL